MKTVSAANCNCETTMILQMKIFSVFTFIYVINPTQSCSLVSCVVVVVVIDWVFLPFSMVTLSAFRNGDSIALWLSLLFKIGGTLHSLPQVFEDFLASLVHRLHVRVKLLSLLITQFWHSPVATKASLHAYLMPRKCFQVVFDKS